jgi:RNA polymerase sigma-70 factor (ECF subfamily)
VTTRGLEREVGTPLASAFATDDAFRAWYERTLPRVYGFLLARTADVSLAEELSQQTFLAAIEQRRRFDGRADVVTWLCGIARHKLADHFRRLEREERRGRRAAIAELPMDAPDWRADVEERDAIRDAVRQLPAAQRAVLLFVDLDGLSVPEAARLLGKSTGAAHSLLFRARESFRAVYRGTHDA